MTDDKDSAVTQADIHAAKLYLQGTGPWKLDEIGIGPEDSLVQAFAKHRLAQSDVLALHLGTVCYKTSDQNRSCDRIYVMTDTVPRQAVIDAIEGLAPSIYDMGERFINTAIALEAINAIPAVTVTDDMVERACMALSGYPSRVSMRAALVAALGE